MSTTTPFPSAPAEPITPLVPYEGLHVLHLFYSVDQGLWQTLSQEEQLEAKRNFATLVQSIRSHPRTQLLTFSVVTPKADLGFMLLTPDLHDANRFEKELTQALGADVLQPSYSYLSMTELSEYTTPESEYKKQLLHELQAKDPAENEESETFAAKLEEWKARMAKYNEDRLYPNMADWPVLCFYPMGKRRNDGNNWYAMDHAARHELMQGHARIGRQWHGKVRQLITGSTGLDLMEWGVTLLAHDTYHIKGIVYQMRFDEVSSKYADFGDFYICLQLPLAELLRRVQLA